jgi:hypothetical protein
MTRLPIQKIRATTLSLLLAEKKRTKEVFSLAFEAAGFTFHRPETLLPTYDKSTLFTGSTISTFKPYLIEAEKELQAFFTVQDCLRTQNNHRMQEEDSYPTWSSFFCSIGAISPYKERHRISQALCEFVKQLGLNSQESLRINISSQDSDLVEMLQEQGLAEYLQFDTQPQPYYRHQFGIDNVRGRNCNLAVSYDKQTFMDIGNLIVIEDQDAPLAIEAAFGLETIVTRLHGLDSSIFALDADAAGHFTEFTAETLYIIDAVIASVAIMSLNIKPIADNRGRVLRRYLQGLNGLRLKNEISMDVITEMARTFELNHYASNHIHPRIERYLREHEQLLRQDKPTSMINKHITNCLY